MLENKISVQSFESKGSILLDPLPLRSAEDESEDFGSVIDLDQICVARIAEACKEVNIWQIFISYLLIICHSL